MSGILMWGCVLIGTILLLGVGGEHAEDDGEPLVDGDLLDAAGGLAGDVVEVRRVAADDAAEADNCGKLAGPRQHFRGDRELEGAGDAVGLDALVGQPE